MSWAVLGVRSVLCQVEVLSYLPDKSDAGRAYSAVKWADSSSTEVWLTLAFSSWQQWQCRGKIETVALLASSHPSPPPSLPPCWPLLAVSIPPSLPLLWFGFFQDLQFYIILTHMDAANFIKTQLEVYFFKWFCSIEYEHLLLTPIGKYTAIKTRLKPSFPMSYISEGK